MRILILIILTSYSFLAHSQQSAAPYVGTTLKGMPCSGNSRGYGPFDYTKRGLIDPKHLKLVEGAHFRPEVENLVEGKHRSSSRSPYPDLDYTLRAWPNHHRGLMTIIRFQIKINKKLTDLKIDVPAECYLQRAVNFSPRDHVSHALYAYYLQKVNHLEDAARYYKNALKLDKKNAKYAYSLGFLLIDLKRYDEALAAAKIAYKYGNPPPKLKDKLKELGVVDKK